MSTIDSRALARILATLSCVLVALTSVAAGMAGAQPIAGCKTFTHRYFLSSGTAITTRVGYVDTNFEICRDGRGYISRAGASQTTGTTGPGNAAGFNIDAGPAVVTDQTGLGASARYSGRLRICIAQRTPLCSESYDYTIFANFSPVGPTLHNREAPRWSHGPQTAGGVQ